MSFLRPIQDFDRPKLVNEYHRAVVVDNQDPQKLHRVKIRIQEIHGTEQEIPNDHLPWAIHFRPTFLGGGPNLSQASIPRIGTEVQIVHIKGDIYQPAYMFEMANDSNRMDQLEEDYPQSYVLRDSDGNYWHVNMEQNKLNVLFNGTELCEITQDRETTIGQNQLLSIGNNKTDEITNDEVREIGNNKTETVDNFATYNATKFTINTSGDTIINASGNVNVTASGEATVDAPLIKLNGAGGGVVTQESIDPITGLPHPDGSSTVFAGDG